MERFFPADRIVKTGNPVRAALLEPRPQEEARLSFGLKPDRPTLLVVGGSLGARTLNESMENGLRKARGRRDTGHRQTGRHFGDRAVKAAKAGKA